MLLYSNITFVMISFFAVDIFCLLSVRLIVRSFVVFNLFNITLLVGRSAQGCHRQKKNLHK